MAEIGVSSDPVLPQLENTAGKYRAGVKDLPVTLLAKQIFGNLFAGNPE